MALSGNASVAISAKLNSSNSGDETTPSTSVSVSESDVYEAADGTNRTLWTDEISLAASGNETWDLNSTEINSLGLTRSAAEVYCIVLVNEGTTDVEVESPAVNGFDALLSQGSTFMLKAGGFVMFNAPAGYDTNSQVDSELKFTNQSGATAASITIYVFGEYEAIP